MRINPKISLKKKVGVIILKLGNLNKRMQNLLLAQLRAIYIKLNF